MVDGFFVSNFAGKTPFAAVNFIMPFLMIVATVGFMFGTGGTAIVAKTFGEFAVLGIIFIRPIASALDELMKHE